MLCTSETMALAILKLFFFSLFLSLSYCADPIAHYCAQSYTSSQIQTNIDQVISDLTTKASVDGFAVTSSGKGNKTIYGLAQCRGDVSADDCSACLASAAKQFPVVCFFTNLYMIEVFFVFESRTLLSDQSFTVIYI